MLIRLCSFTEDILDVLMPLHTRVALTDFHLEQVIVSHVCSQAWHWLTTRTTDTNQESVTSGLLDDTGDTAHMLNGEAEIKYGKNL